MLAFTYYTNFEIPVIKYWSLLVKSHVFLWFGGCVKLATGFIKKKHGQATTVSTCLYHHSKINYKATSVFSKTQILLSNALFVLQLHLGVHKPSGSAMQ